MILSVIDRISQIFKYKFLPEKQSDQLKLPKWVNVSRKRFNEILSTVTEAKNNVLKASIDGREITLDKAESLLKAINKEKINGSEFKKKYSNIADDVKTILQSQCSQEVKIKCRNFITLK